MDILEQAVRMKEWADRVNWASRAYRDGVIGFPTFSQAFGEPCPQAFLLPQWALALVLGSWVMDRSGLALEGGEDEEH